MIWSRFAVAAATLAGVVAPVAAVETTLVELDAIWKVLDDGTDAGTAWREPGFDDSTWASGPAELGYGDGDEATVVGFGPDPGNKHVTTYFRHTFTVDDPTAFALGTVRLRRDDGAVVYVNGEQVFATNMPLFGGWDYRTLARSTVGDTDEIVLWESSFSPAVLVAGTNVVAVEIHQASTTSSDISFALELLASTSPYRARRGPYLQLGTPTSVTVRWRTNEPTDSRVRFGTDPDVLDRVADDAALTTEHAVTIAGLTSDTRYYYAVGTAGEVLAGDARHGFTTAPGPGSERPLRIWVVGDSGTADANARAVRDAFATFSAGRPVDLWLMLGDNAYGDGTDLEYQAAVFDTYPDRLRSSVVWPTFGNHDAESANSFFQSGVYYDIFTLPRFAEAGGVASGTEAYYSFDYGDVHFVCLDSQGSNRWPAGAMLTWLEQDLLATDATWIVAYWHHPPYSKGSHDSDSELQLVQMRENALPILEGYGVDLVLSGHSHSYERSFLLDSHYGTSGTLQPSMILDGGDGRADGDGAYAKPGLGAAHEGAVYVVAGSSGKTSGGTLDHPAMFIAMSELGSLVLDADGTRLDGRFLTADGTVADHFTIVEGGQSCGNGVREGTEACDGADLGTATCAPVSCTADLPSCAADCTLDTSTCPAVRCGVASR